MRINLIKVGNSRGIIIPAKVIKECELNESVDLNVIDGSIVISRINEARADWKKTFAQASPSDKAFMEDTITNAFDDEEWTW
jgi:antitoxin MazE